MNSHDLADLALRRALESVTAVIDELREACEGDTALLRDAVRSIVTDTFSRKTTQREQVAAVVILDAVMESVAPRGDADKPWKEIIRRPRDVTVSAAIEPNRDDLADVLATTTEALWGSSAASTTVLLDGPNFRIVEITCEDGTNRTASF